ETHPLPRAGTDIIRPGVECLARARRSRYRKVILTSWDRESIKCAVRTRCSRALVQHHRIPNKTGPTMIFAGEDYDARQMRSYQLGARRERRHRRAAATRNCRKEFNRGGNVENRIQARDFK